MQKNNVFRGISRLYVKNGGASRRSSELGASNATLAKRSHLALAFLNKWFAGSDGIVIGFTAATLLLFY
jgi:hypothetical protein